jgi:hypothetical protein
VCRNGQRGIILDSPTEASIDANCRSDQRQRDNEAGPASKGYRTARFCGRAEPFQALCPARLGDVRWKLHRDDVGGCSETKQLAVAYWPEAARIAPLPLRISNPGSCGGPPWRRACRIQHGPLAVFVSPSLGLCLVFAGPTFPLRSGCSAEDPGGFALPVKLGATTALTSSAATNWFSPARHSLCLHI